MNERASIKIKYKDYAQQRVGGFNSDNFQIESSQDNYILSDGDERPPMQQMMEQLESSKSTKALGRVRNLNSAHPDLGRQNSELQQIISKTPHHEVNNKQSRLNKLPSQEKHHHQEQIYSSSLNQSHQARGEFPQFKHAFSNNQEKEGSRDQYAHRHHHNHSTISQLQSNQASFQNSQIKKSTFKDILQNNQSDKNIGSNVNQYKHEGLMRASSEQFQFGSGAFPHRSNTQHVAHDSNFDFQMITHQDVMNAFNPLAQSIENLQFQSNLNEQIRSSSSGFFFSNQRSVEQDRNGRRGAELKSLVSGEGTLKTSQNFSSLNRDLPQSIQPIRQESVDFTQGFHQSTLSKNANEFKQTRNPSLNKHSDMHQTHQDKKLLYQSSEVFSPQHASTTNLQRNFTKPPTNSTNIHYQLSQTQGIKRVERVFKNPQLIQSMSSGQALKNAASQSQLNSHVDVSKSSQMEKGAFAQVAHRNRCESVGLSKSGVSVKDRNCKTSSPQHIFRPSSQHHQHQISIGGPYPLGNESRMRKRSKEIEEKKREKFADLIVILGIKYNEFVDQERMKPQVVGGYPDLNDKEFVKKNNYVDNLIWVCFPEGFAIQPFEKKRDGELCQMKIFHFIITNQDGDKKYITSILFKELFLSEKKGALIVPKSICVVSSKPLFTLQKLNFKRQLLSVIFQKVILDINALSIKAYSKETKASNYLPFIMEQTQLQLLIDQEKGNGVLPSQSMNSGNSLTAVDNYLMRKIEFYLSVFFNHLYYSEEVDQDILIEEIRERKLPSTYNQGGRQCPPTCSKKKHKHKEKVVDCFFRFRNTKTYGFTLENYSFELLLQSLKPERILFLITALLLERKIVLIKENFGDIALIMESLVSLMNPLKWNFVFITYLTPKLVECLEAPFPYIIGVSRKVWDDWCVMREYPDDIIIFDIDNQELLNQVREELPALPQPQASVLQRSLKDMLDIKERFIETIQENATKKVSKDKMEEYYWAYAQIRVKQSFFNFFLLTINNYIGYFKNLDEEGNLSPLKKEKQFYDKLSSNDVFDFDKYLDQFEGYNKEFMQKFVRTQSFNNFIEETYKTTSANCEIGFFKTNLEVMTDYSFKKLKKEQNKLLDKTFFNLQNPVKFNIGHMYRQYKKQLIQQSMPKLKQILENEIEGLNEQEKEHVNQDIYSRPDLLQKFLLEDIQQKSTNQLSLLNEFRYDLITKMPGIQYDQISTYEQIKSQRSDQSQERRLQNQTVMNGNTSHLAGLEFNQHSMSLTRAEGFGLGLGFGMNTGKVERSLSLVKSRNQPSHKIVTSRSGDLVTQSFTTKHGEGGLGHKRSQGGVIYDNFLSMANNTNSLHMSQHDQDFRELINKQKNVPLSKAQKEKQIPEEEKKLNSKVRIKSQNTHHQPSFSLNKTLDLQNPSILGNRLQSQTVQQNSIMSKKSSTTRNNALHQSQILSALNNTQGLIKQAFSPKMNLNGSSNDMENTLNLSLKRNIGAGSKSFYKERSLKQNLLKEALTRQIQKERSKVGLMQESSASKNQQLSSNLSPSKEITIKLKNQTSLSRLEDRGMTTQKNSAIKMNQNGNQQSSKRLLPYNPSKIDLMNPRQKKISRNEERKLAMRKGFMNPQQHESFYQFLYSPNEELSKLAMMQVIQRKVENGQIRLGKNRDQMSFSNLLYSGLNENFNQSSMSQNLEKDGDLMARFNQINQANNQIQFQRRLLNEPDLLQANELFLTTIKNQNNWIQQKHQMPQSPSMTNTELSSIKKGHRRHLEQQNHFPQRGEDLNQRVMSPSLADYKMAMNQSRIEKQRTQVNQSEDRQGENYQRSNAEDKKDFGNNSNSKYFINKSLNENSLTIILPSSQKQNFEDLAVAGITGDENLDSIETRPLKVIEEDIGYMMSRTHVSNLKQSHYSQIDSRDKNQSNQKQRQAEKHKGLDLSGQQQHGGINSNNQPTVRKDFKAFNPSNKSPLLQSGKYSAHNSKNIKDMSVQSQPSNFESSSHQQKSHDVLNRKRSTPALGQDKSSQASLKNSSNLKNQHLQKTKSGENQVEKRVQQQFSYFKKRPLNQNTKSQKNSHVITATVDLVAKPKFTEQNPSRMDISKEMSSLRISPIPNLNEILGVQQQKFDQSINFLDPYVNQNSSAGNPSGQDGSSSQPNYNNSSSGVSEDQVLFKNIDSNNNYRITSLSNNNRVSNLQNNFSSLQNPLSSNYQSRQSEKSFLQELNLNKMKQNQNFSSKPGLESQNINNMKQEEAMFSSMSQLLQQDLFEKAHMTLNGPQTARNESISRQKFSSSQFKKASQGAIFNLSQRSSSNQQLNFHLRASNISGEGHVRPSNASSNNDLFKFRKEKSNQKLTMIENNSSSRHSDILSQYEPQNNISVSVLKSSPRMNQGKTFSRTTKNQEQYNPKNGDNQSLMNKQNFQMQGVASKIETVQPSVLTSHDTQNMKLLLNALKQNIPTSQTELVTANTSKAKINVNKMNSKGGQTMNLSLSQNNSAAQKSSRVQQRVDCNGQSVNVVNIDLNRGNKMIISPKGLSGQKLKEGQLLKSSQSNASGQKLVQRNSSIEEIKRNINMSVESKNTKGNKNSKIENSQKLQTSQSNYFNASGQQKKLAAQSLQNSGHAQIGGALKKHIRSPQPKIEMAESLSSKMKALKSMHSQEFNLKEKSIRNGREKNEVSNFSSDPMVELSKEFNKSTSKKQKDQQNLLKSAFYNYSSTKNLKDSQLERSHIKELNFNNFVVEPSGNHKFSSELGQSSTKQKYHPQQLNKMKELNSSLQNTSLHKIKDQIVLKTFEEQKHYNSVQQNARKNNIDVLLEQKQQQRLTSLILEEPFVDDSQVQSPESQQSSSPMNANDADTPQDDFQNHSNFSSGNPQIKFGIVKDFQTLNAHASSKIGDSFANIRSQFNQTQKQETTILEKDLETVRNNDFQVMNFDKETKVQAIAAKQSIVAHNQAKQRESTHELNIESQEVDLSKQGFEVALQQSKQQKSSGRHGSVEEIQRVSKINQEVDQLINEMSYLRTGAQNEVYQGSKTSKSKVQLLPKHNQVARHQESVDLMRESLESSKYSYRMRVQSQYQYSDMLQPLNENKQMMNREHINLNRERQQVYRAGDKLLKGLRKSEHLGSYKSENSLSQFDSSSKNSNLASQDIQLFQNKLTREGLAKNERRKRSHYRHGMTTCFGQPGGKESSQYLKKDLNQDAFCKINSHIGDIDNDPHTPKSDQTLSSHEKNSKAYRQKGEKSSKRRKHNTFYSEKEHNQRANLRIQHQNSDQQSIKAQNAQRHHSISVDQKYNLGAPEDDVILENYEPENNISHQKNEGQIQTNHLYNNLNPLVEIKNPQTIESDATHKLNDYDYSQIPVDISHREENQIYRHNFNEQDIMIQYQSQDVTSNYNQHIEFLYSDDQCRQIDQLLQIGDNENNKSEILQDQRSHKLREQDLMQEVIFDESDLNDFDDKYTSRDKNFNRLKLQQQILLQQQNFAYPHNYL